MSTRRTTISTPCPSTAQSRALAQELRDLYEEIADRLDSDDVEAFPGYFVEDCCYQVVSRENFSEDLPTAALYCDGMDMLRDRVVALRESQVYVPRTWRHFISGVRIMAEQGTEIHARANFLVTECMADREPTVFLVGQYQDILTRVDGRLLFKQHLAIYDNHHIKRSLIVPV